MSHLLLMTPAADALVAHWREEHDWTAASGVGAHVTVRVPFFGVARAEDPELQRILAALLPVEVTLGRLEDRPGALVIVVEPDDGVRALTEATSAAWPELGAHKDGRLDLAYHVTLVRTPGAPREAAAAELAPLLPVRVPGTELRIAERKPAGGIAWASVAHVQAG